MPIDVRLLASNVLRNALLEADMVGSPRAFRDLVALSSGYDFLLQASNQMCAGVAFNSLGLLWIKHHLDAQAIAALRASGASFLSHALQRIVNSPVGTGEMMEVLLIFRAHDVLFDAPDRCRVRLSVRVAMGTSFQMPKEPGLGRRLVPGEAVQIVNPRLGDPVGPLSQGILAGELPTLQPPLMRTQSGDLSGGINIPGAAHIDRARALEPDRHLELGDRTSFEVVAWLGNGVLEIPAVFAAAGDQMSKTIKVAADVHESSPHFTELSHDPALLLSQSDPLGFVQSITFTVRRRGSVQLVNAVSLLGGPATARAGHLGPLAADTFPTRTGACSLNIAATVVPGRIAARNTIEFIESSRYGVVWSADAVRLLVRYCWETGAFPRGIVQSQTLRVSVDGVQQDAEAISVFELEELTDIELEFDSNGNRDVLYTNGSARVVPKFVRLRNGTELHPKDANDPMFAPSKRVRWSAFGELTEDPISATSPDLEVFLRAVTRGVTSRLGRPFTDPPFGVLVTHSRLSAPAQRVALLVK